MDGSNAPQIHPKLIEKLTELDAILRKKMDEQKALEHHAAEVKDILQKIQKLKEESKALIPLLFPLVMEERELDRMLFHEALLKGYLTDFPPEEPKPDEKKPGEGAAPPAGEVKPADPAAAATPTATTPPVTEPKTEPKK